MSAYHPKAVVLGCAPEPPLLGRTGSKTQESRYAIRPLLLGGFGLICVSADRTSVLNKEPIRKSRMNFEILSIDNEFPNSIESNIQSQPLLMGAENRSGPRRYRDRRSPRRRRASHHRHERRSGQRHPRRGGSSALRPAHDPTTGAGGVGVGRVPSPTEPADGYPACRLLGQANRGASRRIVGGEVAEGHEISTIQTR